MSIKQVTDETFQAEVLDSELPVLVDFGATWCGPCRTQLPILEKFAEMQSKIKVLKVDIDDSPLVTAKYGVRSVPSLMLFERGERSAMKVGVTPLSELNKLLKAE